MQTKRRQRGEATTSPFRDWLPAVTPLWEWGWRYQQVLYDHLQAVTDRQMEKLMLFLPPRHGKSELATVRYAAWRLEREPATRVIIGAYNSTLAEKFSRKCRRIVENRIPLSKDRTAVLDWETATGGGVRAVGVGGGITGQGGNLIIIDDPVKSREEANSETYRERVWDWYKDDLYTRREPGCALILIMTRWHEDDLAGRILASEDGPNWTVVTLPAEAEENDPLGREPGEALCPERYDLAALKDIRQTLGNSYYALYQQRPLPAEGGMFKRHWFEVVQASPAVAERVRYWDNAGTDAGGDWTAGVLMARAGTGVYCVEDVVRGQWSAMQREDVKRQTAELDQQRYGHVSVWNEQEPGSGGKESAAATVRNLEGFAIRTERVTGDKAVRAEPFAAQAEAGNVKLLSGAWNAAYIEELCAFPQGKHDDMVDASSGAFNKLAQWFRVRMA